MAVSPSLFWRLIKSTLEILFCTRPPVVSPRSWNNFSIMTLTISKLLFLTGDMECGLVHFIDRLVEHGLMIMEILLHQHHSSAPEALYKLAVERTHGESRPQMAWVRKPLLSPRTSIVIREFGISLFVILGGLVLVRLLWRGALPTFFKRTFPLRFF